MKVYPSTSESLKIVLQINRYVFKLLEKKCIEPPPPPYIQVHVFVIICEHMVLRRVWFIRCGLFCWCNGCCSNSICSACCCCCCCWVCCFAQGNELITVRVYKLSIKNSWLICFLKLTYLYHCFAVRLFFFVQKYYFKTLFFFKVKHYM